MYSEVALKIYSAISEGVIKSRFQFWTKFSTLEEINKISIDVQKYKKFLSEKNYNIACCFDEAFPKAKNNVKLADKPFLFAYRGDIGLLNNTDNNIAVIGVLNPDDEIIAREKKIVSKLIGGKKNIISGLACGCDTVAHETAITHNGKTVAFLPSTLENICPVKNKRLAERILEKGGLIITEYIGEPSNKSESIKRFIERDRLQAMYSNAVVLIASYRHGEGDSGSRHAMGKAAEYGMPRFIMFNEQTDSDNPVFGLNADLFAQNVPIITEKRLQNLVRKSLVFIVDLDDTLVSSTKLNNDAYNFALEKYGFARINRETRITKDDLAKIEQHYLKRIIDEKQKYFLREWMSYRLVLNNTLIEKLAAHGKENCLLWTKADRIRVDAIVKYYELDKYFASIIFDDKTDFDKSLEKIKTYSVANEIVLYENENLINGSKKYSIRVIDTIKDNVFDVTGYLVITE